MNINKQIKRLYASYIAWRYEHIYYSQDGLKRQKYLYIKGHAKSQTLIVVFPGCWKGGAKYDYVRTIKDKRCHKIWLLDDSGTNHHENYLMGEGKQELVISLLSKFIAENNISKIIFCGSSKGGTSALYFSLYLPNVDVYIGAPQYHVGSYLNNDTQKPSLVSILGSEPTKEKVLALDKHIQNTLLTSDVIPRSIHLLYSNVEHTYKEHIRDLIEDIHKRRIPLHETILDFPNHSQVGGYFVTFLKEQLRDL